MAIKISNLFCYDIRYNFDQTLFVHNLTYNCSQIMKISSKNLQNCSGLRHLPVKGKMLTNNLGFYSLTFYVRI